MLYHLSYEGIPKEFYEGGEGSESHSVMSDSLQPMDCSLPGSSVLGILQARILEWVVMPSSRDVTDPGIEPGFLALPLPWRLRW